MIELLFKNNVHEEGPNTTMRKGVKWSLALDRVDEVLLKETGSSERGVPARILNVNVMRMIDLKGVEPSVGSLYESDSAHRMLEIQHDPACRTYNGLAFRMFEVYGHGKMSSYDIITVIEYEPIEYTPGDNL